ncbi:hypothetical protein GCM10007301_24870 [Azorhizobium oxalatiphilum]|uniref:Lysozyme inhibitor LprI-like N-terminal domain-containing protein n=1 Tax=Azorhizobium oxalatiphilum TaxID=980631 RepID=A0A917C1C8_9HYPH|nr:lysozyme inhibitor LprI family protein [Azorhizobium oxalatiphilum]GGF64065.1 hypothetical protein GCM10007301_24870 [Azorhizobium oxalatiphilum]
MPFFHAAGRSGCSSFGLLTAGLSLAAILALPRPAAAAGPSFDCKAARSKTEKAICADPALSALDRRMADAYRKAMAGLDTAGKAALKNDQIYFLQVRDIQLEQEKEFRLDEDMDWRVKFLASITPAPRTGFTGKWVNANGEITVAAAPGGGFKVEINTVQPYPSYPMCAFHADGALSGQTLVVGGGADDMKENDGWTATLTRTGAALKAELVRAKTSEYASPPFCGFRSSIDGNFLPVQGLPDDPRL